MPAVNALPCPHPHIPGERGTGRQRALARRALPGAAGFVGSVWASGIGQTEGALIPLRLPAHIQVVDERLVGLREGGAVLAVHVQPPLGFPEVRELPPVPQQLPQGAAPGQGHPGEKGPGQSRGCCRCPAVPVPTLRVPAPPA